MQLTDEQCRIAQELIDRPFVALWADMGAGKTAVTLTAVNALLQAGKIDRAIVVAPRAVANDTWTSEAAKWFGDALRVVVLRGSQNARIRARNEKAHIYTIGRDGVAKSLTGEPSDDLIAIAGDASRALLIVDEASSIKNPSSNRFKALKAIQWGRVIELTGTPAPQSLADVWAQIYLLDRGKALGRNISAFRRAFMECQTFRNFREWRIKPSSERIILQSIEHLVLRVEAPPPCEVTTHDIFAELSPEALRQYDTMKRSCALSLDKTTITASSAGALVQKLASFASGGLYDEEGNAASVHLDKARALWRFLRGRTTPTLVFYWFKFSLDDIERAAKAADKSFEVFDPSSTGQIERWNRGEIDVFAAHPQSAGMGLNLQFGGFTILWYTVTWCSELWLQANARLARRGQSHAVEVYRLIARHTIDEQIADRCGQKVTAQQLILDYFA